MKKQIILLCSLFSVFIFSEKLFCSTPQAGIVESLRVTENDKMKLHKTSLNITLEFKGKEYSWRQMKKNNSELERLIKACGEEVYYHYKSVKHEIGRFFPNVSNFWKELRATIKKFNMFLQASEENRLKITNALMEIELSRLRAMDEERLENEMIKNSWKGRNLFYMGAVFRYEGGVMFNDGYGGDYTGDKEITFGFRLVKFFFNPAGKLNVGFAFDATLSKRKISYQPYYYYYSGTKISENYYYANFDLALLFKFSKGTFQHSYIFGGGLSYALRLSKNDLFSYSSTGSHEVPRHAIHYKIISGYLYTPNNKDFALSISFVTKFLSDCNRYRYEVTTVNNEIYVGFEFAVLFGR